MEMAIPQNNLRVFASAVQCLMKVGKELFIEATADQLILRTLNDAKSAFAAFYFNDAGGFFESFRCDASPPWSTRPGEERSQDGFDTQGSAGAGGGSVSCKVPVRAVHGIFRTLKKVVRLVVYLEGEDEDHIEPQLVFQMYCEYGYRKVHRFSLQDCEIMHAVFEGEGASRLSCPPIQLSQLLEHIHGTVEVAVGASHDVLTVRSFHHPLTGSAERAVLKTEMSISTAEFDTYRFCGEHDEEVELVFSLKEIKSLLHFCDVTEAQSLEMLFREGGDPLLFQSHSRAFAGELIMATMEPKIIRKEEENRAQSVAAGGARPSSGNSEHHGGRGSEQHGSMGNRQGEERGREKEGGRRQEEEETREPPDGNERREEQDQEQMDHKLSKERSDGGEPRRISREHEKTEDRSRRRRRQGEESKENGSREGGDSRRWREGGTGVESDDADGESTRAMPDSSASGRIMEGGGGGSRRRRYYPDYHDENNSNSSGGGGGSRSNRTSGGSETRVIPDEQGGGCRGHGHWAHQEDGDERGGDKLRQQQHNDNGEDDNQHSDMPTQFPGLRAAFDSSPSSQRHHPSSYDGGDGKIRQSREQAASQSAEQEQRGTFSRVSHDRSRKRSPTNPNNTVGTEESSSRREGDSLRQGGVEGGNSGDCGDGEGGSRSAGMQWNRNKSRKRSFIQEEEQGEDNDGSNSDLRL